MEQWTAYSDKFNSSTTREQYLIIATGLVAIIFILFSVFLDTPMQRIEQLNSEIAKTQKNNQDNIATMQILEQALSGDPDVALKKELAQYQDKLGEIDEQLLALTSDLIDPFQMRLALIKLLKLQKGVKLLSFEVLPASPVTKAKVETTTALDADTQTTLTALDSQPEQLRLYRHGIKIKLQGQYFQLKDYLSQLEGLSWKFFWQEFDYQLKAYPVSELEIEIYSLSTAQEFIGV